MIFADPIWFLLLVPLAAWGFATLRAEEKRSALPYSDLTILKKWSEGSSARDQILVAVKIAALALMIVAMARPQKVSKHNEPPKPVVDIVLCMDTSMSMAAVDFDPKNRLEAAKDAAEEFIRKRPVDRMGLVVFGGKAIVQCPLTLDHETLIDFLKSIPINATQTDGTAIGTGISVAASLLSQSEAKSKVIVALTDGRNNTGTIDPVTAAQAANDLGIKIYTIGCAVPGGGLIPVEDPVFGKRMAQMAEDLDEGTLAQIAAMTQAKYFRVTSAKKFAQIYDEIDRLEKTKIETRSLVQAHDVYVPFLMAGVLIFLGSILAEQTLLRTVP